MYVEAKVVRARLADKLPPRTLQRWSISYLIFVVHSHLFIRARWMEVCASCHGFAWTISYLNSELLLKNSDIMIGVDGAKLIEVAEYYQFSTLHKRLVSRAMDFFLMDCTPLQVFRMSFANIAQESMAMKKLVDATIQGRADTMDGALFGTWGHLSAQDFGAVCRAHEFTWQ